jgi:hypothetical protein
MMIAMTAGDCIGAEGQYNRRNVFFRPKVIDVDEETWRIKMCRQRRIYII